MIPRKYDIASLVKQGRVVVIYGPRRVGKTTVLKDYLDHCHLEYKLDSGERIDTQQILSSQNFEQMVAYVKGFDLLAIDEAQQIPNIGLGLKILVDQVPNLRIIATGSSSFDLANKLGEPLTGRKRTITMYPLAQTELLGYHKKNAFTLQQELEQYLIYGSYPEIVIADSFQEKRQAIEEIANSYLLKDIIMFEQIKSAKIIFDLLKLLAFQIGSEVSFAELARQLGISGKTVERYLDLLEKSFVVQRMYAYSRNLRSEIRGKFKCYFLDCGIRNAVISQFNTLRDRNDIGQLWENFFVSERIKYTTIHNAINQRYFWRTYTQQEVDFVEDGDGKIDGYEIKWNLKKSNVSERAWKKAYPKASYTVVTKDNYLKYLL